MSAIEMQYAAVLRRLGQSGTIGQVEVNLATDFAIDANAAGRADLTINLLQILVGRAPKFAKAWQLLGLAWRDQGEMERAGEAFDLAASLSPGDARIALGKAQIAFESGRPAAHLFQAVRTVAPNDGELALSTASAHVHEGRPKEGERLIEAMLERDPTWLRGLDALATMRWMAGDSDGFDRAFSESVAARPQIFPLWLGWYRAVSQVGLWAKAKAIIADCRRRFGERIEIDAIEANMATEQGDDERAEMLFARCASLDDPGTKISFIRHCLRTGQLDRAETVGLKLVETPMAATAWPYLSTLWRLKGDARANWIDGNPPHIRQFDLPILPSDLDILAAHLRQLHLSTHHPPEQSLRGGTQTQGHLFLRSDPELGAIKTLILDACREYVDGLPPYVAGHPLLGTPRGALHFQGAWSVRLAAQGFHVVHTHPLGWISSAFYVALPECMGPENRNDGKAGWLQLGAPPPDLRLDLAPYAQIEPKPGRLVLFPSTMWHGTLPFADGERLSIAFDIRTPAR